MQLITGLRIAENGSYCENVKKRRKSQGGGGGGGCVQRMEVIVKRKKSQWGGGGGRVDVNGEVKLL